MLTDVVSEFNKMSFSLNAPSSSLSAIHTVSEMKPKRFAKLSQRILQDLPIANPSAMFSLEEKQQLCEGLHADLVQVDNLVTFLHSLWRDIVFYQPNQATMREVLTKANVPENVVETISAVWNEIGAETVSRLADLSCSGLPRVHSTLWGVDVVVTADATSSCKEALLKLQLKTSSGSKNFTLSYDEASRLLQATNDAQRVIDRLTQ